MLGLSPTLALAGEIRAPAGEAASASSEAQSSTGVISGRILGSPGLRPALSLFLENLETDAVTIVPLEAGQETFTAVVRPGTYQAYTWLPDFTLLGAHTACGGPPPCADHTLLSVPVNDGQSVAGVDVSDWFVPESPLLTLRGRLIDGSGAEPLEDGVLVIWDRHIITVGPAGDSSVPEQGPHHHLPGTTMLPGFINAHVHNAYRRSNLEQWAQAGVTTVRDLGAPIDFPWDTLRRYYRDDPRCARVLAAGPLVTCPDGYPIVPNGFPSLAVDSEQEAREEIDRLIDRGADVIKIVIESGVPAVLSVELATAIVDAAHARGVPVSVHLNREVDLETALAAGVDDVAHIVLDYVPDDTIRGMVDADVGWVPTLAALGGFGTQVYDNLERFVAAGGRVALGNDAGYLAGLVIGMPMPEIEEMLHAGMTPMQVIVASTSDAAAVCHREETLGTLEAGKIADVLVVEGDPLHDPRALQAVRMVVHEGEIIRHEPPAPRRLRGRLGPG